MSKQANTKLIGGFVVGAIVLVVIGVLLFGSGKLLSKQRKFVLFFEDSVKGLNIGAPVDFKGVKVGTVTDIKIVINQQDLSPTIPIFIEIDPDRINYAGSESDLTKMSQGRGEKSFLELLISQGLRAQLTIQSLVTGQLGIHLDFYPDKPLNLVGGEPGYLEIPTIQLSLSALSKTMENVNFADLADKVAKTMDGIEKLVNSPDIMETVVSVKQTFTDAQTLLRNLDSQLKPLAANSDLTLGEARKMLDNVGQLARNLDSRLPQLVTTFEATLKTTDTSVRQAGKAVDGVAGDNSPVRLELVKTLNEFSSMARSIRLLAQYLESHPEALIRGKGK